MLTQRAREPWISRLGMLSWADMLHKRQLKTVHGCNQDWSAMAGGSTTRFCSSCERDVHDLSALGERAAKRLLSHRSGSICVRFASNRSGEVIFRRAPPPSSLRRFVASAVTASSISACTAATPQTDERRSAIAVIDPQNDPNAAAGIGGFVQDAAVAPATPVIAIDVPDGAADFDEDGGAPVIFQGVIE